MPFSDIFEATYTHYFWDPTFFWLTLYLNVKTVISAFNPEKSLVKPFLWLWNFKLREDSFPALMAVVTFVMCLKYDHALHCSFNYAMRQVFSVTVHHNLSTLLKLWIMHISGVCSELKYERETKLMVISTKKAPAEQSIVYFRGVDPLWE